jgi:mRNA-degrading endonuclease toxin of MazEF toxin-antitoxin module
LDVAPVYATVTATCRARAPAPWLRVASVANCDNLQTIPKAAIGPRPLGRLPVPELAQLDRALRFALGIRE